MIIITLCLLLISSVVSAQQLAFPSAEGWGRFATGGRGGGVYKVTNLTNQGPGSLRACLKDDNAIGKRTCIFDVSGVIDMTNPTDSESVTTILVNEVTVAGQTAPGNGIVVKNAWLSFRNDDTIVRYFKSRPGLIGYSITGDGKAHSSFKAIDTTGADRAIIDRSSFSWATDDVVGINSSRDVTVQWSIIAEGLRVTSPAMNLYSRPMLIDNGSTDRVSILHNLIANCQDRLPQVSAGEVQVVNNLIYNGLSYSQAIPQGLWGIQVAYIANYFLGGPSSPSLVPRVRSGSGYSPSEAYAPYIANSVLYFSGNYHPNARPNNTYAEDAILLRAGNYPFPVTGTPLAYPSVPTTTALQARTDVLAKAGARIPGGLDAVDQRQVTSVQNLTGSFTVASPSAVGGYPTIPLVTRDGNYDTDGDGIPNAWETLCASALTLSPSNGSDGNDIISGVDADVNGYSKLEVYLNEVAGDYSPDSCGNQLGSDTTPPTGVAIIEPDESDVVSGTSVAYDATATDAVGMSRVEFYQNNTLIASDSSSPYSIIWDTTLIPDGDKELKVIAYDTSDNPTTSAIVNVDVDNIAGYTAIHTASSPTIDGDLSDFAGANSVEISGATNTTTFQLMWNSTALYIGVSTLDSYLEAATTVHDTSTMYNDDSVEIVIDTDNDGVWETTDYKFMLNAQNTTFDARNLSDLTYEPTYTTSVVRTGDLDGVADDTSWIAEIAIPWAQMGGISAAADQIYGINVQINDDDGARTAYRWNGSINTLADAQDVTLGIVTGGGDTTPPFDVALTDPLADQYIHGMYSLQATAQDNAGIESVEFFRGSTSLGTDILAPFTYAWDTTAVASGSYALKVRACDTAGTPNCTDSAVVNVTVDNTAPSNPSDLVVSPDVDGAEIRMSLDWVASTDASGTLTYGVEQCNGVGCSGFTQIQISSTDDAIDGPLAENTTYCYRVRAYDAALNPSASYSNTACAETPDLVIAYDPPTDVSTTADGTVAFPSVVTDISTSAESIPAEPFPVTDLSTSAESTVTFPSVVTGVE